MEDKNFWFIRKLKLPPTWHSGIVVELRKSQIGFVKLARLRYVSPIDLNQFVQEKLFFLADHWGLKWIKDIYIKGKKTTLFLSGHIKGANLAEQTLFNQSIVPVLQIICCTYLKQTIIIANKINFKLKTSDTPRKQGTTPVNLNFSAPDWMSKLKIIIEQVRKNNKPCTLPEASVRIRRRVHRIVSDYPDLISKSIGRSKHKDKKIMIKLKR